MSQRLSLRSVLAETARSAPGLVRRAPVACGLVALALLVPSFVGGWMPPLAVALLLVGIQAALAVFGWAGLLSAGQGMGQLAPVGVAARVLASILLNSLFLALIGLVLGLVLLGTAGATGLADGDDLTMAAQASVSAGGWETWVLLALEITAILLMLTLFARLTPSGPATAAEGRVVSLAALGWTRGSGLKPATGLIAALTPSILLVLSALVSLSAGPWIDWVWAGVLGFIQAPLLAAFATAMWRQSRPEGVSE